MVNLGNERTNFTFSATENNINFEGNCVYSNGSVIEMRARVVTAAAVAPDSSISPVAPVAAPGVSEVVFNRNGGPDMENVGKFNFSINNVSKADVATIATAGLQLLAELENTNE